MGTHNAIVAKIDRVVEIPGADKIHTAFVLGQQVVVSKDWKEGMVGVFFEPDLQLSEEFCSFNNLFRDPTKNRDSNAKGFFENNRRVRCQPFLKVRSEGFFCETSALRFCGEDWHMGLKVGDQLNELNGQQICQKYISEKTRKAMSNIQKKKTKVVATPMFHKHVDTDQFAYYVNSIPKGALISIHAKVHGTSGRYSYTKVKREPESILDKVKDYFLMFKRESWEYVVGTRNVVLYNDQYEKQGFHGSEQFRFDVLETLKPFLEKGMTVYGELAGFANGGTIMPKHYTAVLRDKKFKAKYGEEVTYKYGCVTDTLRFHVYRISYTNEEGIELDFTDQQVMQWCDKHGILGPLAVHEPFIYDGDSEKLKALVANLTERPECMTEDYIDPSHVSEGVIVRVDHQSQVPKFYKSKSYAFKVMEGIAKENEVDLEDAS